jgi:hypothetical protein
MSLKIPRIMLFPVVFFAWLFSTVLIIITAPIVAAKCIDVGLPDKDEV